MSGLFDSHKINFPSSSNTLSSPGNMQKSTEQSTLFWDRVPRLIRIKSNGEEVQKGSAGGLNIVRIQKGRTCSFVTAYCIMQQLVNANILQWPSGVSEDGLTIYLWLFDVSLGRSATSKRLFHFTFFDKVAASRFLEKFTEGLPSDAQRGLSYWEFRNGVSDTEDEPDSEEEKVIDETLVGEENDLDDGNHEHGNGGAGDESADDEEVDELRRIMELEANWGESQCLFNPMAPEDL